MTLDAGTIAILPFPYSDLTATKRRPVLLLTAPDSYGDFIGMAVTSQAGHADNLAILQSMMESGSLPKASFIRTDKVVSLNQSLIVKEVGKVTESLRARPGLRRGRARPRPGAPRESSLGPFPRRIEYENPFLSQWHREPTPGDSDPGSSRGFAPNTHPF